MIKIKNRLIQLFCITALIISGIFVSCEKEPDSLGFGILPGEENINAKFESDSNIIATTIKLDSILSYYPDTSFAYAINGSLQKARNVLGDYQDPFWGKTQSSLLLNFYPDSANPNFGTNPIIDSLILYLNYDSVYGNKETEVELTLSELNKPLNYQKIYFSNIDAESYKGSTLVKTKVQFKDTLLKIKIDGTVNPSFISKLLNVPVVNQTSILKFQEHIKGVWLDVKSLSNPGLLVYVNPFYEAKLNAPFYSKMTLYYKNSVRDTAFNYYFVQETVRSQKIEHDYVGSGIETALQNNEFSQKVTYVQGMGGLATKFRIPNLSKWADLAPVSINKAELIIPVDQTQLNNTVGNNIPPKLNLLAVSEEGKIQNIEYGFGQTFLGGVYNKEKKVYIFNLAKHLQQIANGKLRNSGVGNSDFIIVADGFTIGQTPTFSAVPLDFSSGKGVKLNIIYTKQ